MFRISGGSLPSILAFSLEFSWLGKVVSMEKIKTTSTGSVKKHPTA
jgi:hypothetical protein